jgi:hypothetical protein
MKQNHGFYNVFLQFQFFDVQTHNVSIFAIFFSKSTKAKKPNALGGEKAGLKKPFLGATWVSKRLE